MSQRQVAGGLYVFPSAGGTEKQRILARPSLGGRRVSRWWVVAACSTPPPLLPLVWPAGPTRTKLGIQHWKGALFAHSLRNPSSRTVGFCVSSFSWPAQIRLGLRRLAGSLASPPAGLPGCSDARTASAFICCRCCRTSNLSLRFAFRIRFHSAC